MNLRRLSWAQYSRGGVPPLFWIRPLSGALKPPKYGAPYPHPENKVELTRARQLYEQNHITSAEVIAAHRPKKAPKPKVAEK